MFKKKKKQEPPAQEIRESESIQFQLLKYQIEEHVRYKIATGIEQKMRGIPNTPEANHFLAGLEAAHEVALGLNDRYQLRENPSLF